MIEDIKGQFLKRFPVEVGSLSCPFSFALDPQVADSKASYESSVGLLSSLCVCNDSCTKPEMLDVELEAMEAMLS